MVSYKSQLIFYYQDLVKHYYMALNYTQLSLQCTLWLTSWTILEPVVVNQSYAMSFFKEFYKTSGNPKFVDLAIILHVCIMDKMIMYTQIIGHGCHNYA